MYQFYLYLSCSNVVNTYGYIIHARLPGRQWAIPEETNRQRYRGHGISRDIEEIANRIYRG